MTILLAGGTGFLGPRIVRLLTSQGMNVRIMTRNPTSAGSQRNNLVEVMEGDVRRLADTERATTGVSTVISAISGFGLRGVSPRTVDWQGNRNLITAAEKAGVEHFILISILGAAPNHPMELHRMKHLAEQELKASRLAWTIIRPSAYTEAWGKLLWDPLLRTGKTRIFGRGENPINFVSAEDVARFVELSVTDPEMRGVQTEVGGPDNLTLKDFLQTFQVVTGKTGSTTHVPLRVLRIMSLLLRPVNPRVARLANAAVIMDSIDMSFDASETRRRFSSIPPTRVEDVVMRDYVQREPMIGSRSSRTPS